MPATTRRQSRLLTQVQTSPLLQLPYEILVMILECAIGELKMGSIFSDIPAIPRVTTLKLVCKVFAELADDTLVRFAKDKKTGFRLQRIVCEPNERSLNILRAVSANAKLNPLIQTLQCYQPRNCSEFAQTYLEDYSETIRTFSNVRGLMLNSICHGGISPCSGVQWDGVGEVFFEWFSQMLWTLSKMRKRHDNTNQMLDVGWAPLSVLTSWIPYGCSVRTRTFSNITSVFIDIGEIDEHNGESQAWNIILKNMTGLQRLEFGWDNWHRCKPRRSQAVNFIYQCLKWQMWSDLYRLRLPFGYSSTELFDHFLKFQRCLYSLDLLLDFNEFESAEGAVSFLDILKQKNLWECSISMRGYRECWKPSQADQTWAQIARDGAIDDWRDEMELGYNIGYYVIEGKKEWDKELGIWEYKHDEVEANRAKSPVVTD